MEDAPHTGRSIAIVALTYNERENIEKFVSRVFALKIKNLHLYIVDDNSPDGTGALADELANRFPITVFHRPRKEGVGPAYRDAFERILRGTHPPDFIFEIDADLSHDTEDIPRLLAATAKADLVVGSRYVQGGGVKNWSYIRHLVSWLGNLYARAVLRAGVHDLTSGFKCYSAHTLRIVTSKATESIGYNFQIETTYRAFRAGLKIVEVPIIFSERSAGESKFRIRIILESFWRVLMLKIRS